ncbi:flagellin [Limibaculum sp. FT325]|uniref:flagellin N-terminal helical domain-containing protein n=1 Tax=Thermohalobaculum sediminis TaxID=2939436 RepID=UPI0020BFF958|nr:flagellin [Limibaculum sediminis]MCL5778913.1 flagellin [Limibaculum sediminis]
MAASVLTNNSAMIALQNLRSTNQNLAEINSQISTGKKVATAKDNAAVFAISSVMESDVAGFKAISESLSLGGSTLAVASNGAKQVGQLLNEIKGKIVAANEGNVDRQKLQDEVSSLRSQIEGIVNAAQFNGLNLLSNTDKTAGSSTVDILSSLDRASDGTVTASQISVGKQDLSTQQQNITGTALVAAADNLTGAAAGTATAIAGAATPATQAVTIDAVSAGFGFSIAISGGAVGAAGLNTGGSNDISYVARDGDTAEDAARGLADAFNQFIAEKDGSDPTVVPSTIRATATGGTVTITGSSVAGDNFSVNFQSFAATGNTIGGGLSGLANIDVSTEAGAESALGEIEGLIQTTINAQAAFGTAEKRVELQNEFMSSLVDSFKSGIGALVDADLEEASARLQALQVQQQLGVQALSIANQAPQNILALFR